MISTHKNLVFLVILVSFVANIMTSFAAVPSPFGPLAFLPAEPVKKCSSLVVLLHGLGDRGDSGWLETMKNAYHLSRAHKDACVLLPTARKILVSRFGQETTAWFDLPGSGPLSQPRPLSQEADFNAIKESIEYIMKVTQDAMKRFDLRWNQVLFSGFSQGAALAIVLGLIAPQRPAGVVSMGGFLLAQDYLKQLAVSDLSSENGKKKSINKDVPFLFIHGLKDTMVAIERPMYAIDFLKKNCGVENIEIKTHPSLGHSMNDEMFKVFFKFVDDRFAEGEKMRNSDL